jgi:multidrug efflux pump
LAEAMVLVVLVVYLFLESWRATLIPMVAVPVSLIGTFIGLYALGFSINTITLFGMVLAIGIVVDDAIVVVENVERHMREDRLWAKDAAKRAMNEVMAPIIAIVLVLVSVFAPVGFVGGITGALYKQFAATIAISVTVSGFVALTLSPALCAAVLRPHAGERGGFWLLFNRLFGRTQRGYTNAVAALLTRPVRVMAVFGVLIAVSISLFQTLPKSFVPEDDQGYFIVVAQLPDGASKQRTVRSLKK